MHVSSPTGTEAEGTVLCLSLGHRRPATGGGRLGIRTGQAAQEYHGFRCVKVPPGPRPAPPAAVPDWCSGDEPESCISPLSSFCERGRVYASFWWPLITPKSTEMTLIDYHYGPGHGFCHHCCRLTISWFHLIKELFKLLEACFSSFRNCMEELLTDNCTMYD